jgi:hypothetical protein
VATAESVTPSVSEHEPAVVGVPESSPVDVLNDKPGHVPDIDQVFPPAPGKVVVAISSEDQEPAATDTEPALTLAQKIELSLAETVSPAQPDTGDPPSSTL